MYEPSGYVKICHNTPHLTQQLTATSNQFNPKDGINYSMSVGILPGIFLALGIISIILYQSIVLCRYCCCRNWVCDDDGMMTRDSLATEIERPYKKPKIWIPFYIVIAMTITAICCVLLGSIDLVVVIKNVREIMGQIGVKFDTVDSDVLDIGDIAATIITILNGNDCILLPTQDKNDGINTMNSIINTTNTMHTNIKDIPTNINTYQTQYTTVAGIPDNNYLFYIYIAILLFTSYLLLQSWWAKSKPLLSFTIVWTEIIVLLLTLLACIIWIITVFISDYCMAPGDNTIVALNAIMGKDNSINSAVDYYINEIGTNPFYKMYNESKTKAQQQSDKLSPYSSVPGLNSCVNNVNTQIAFIVDDLDKIYTQVNFTSINTIYVDMVEKNTCTYVVKDFFIIFLTMFLTAGCLYAGLVMVSYFYTIFSKRHQFQETTSLFPRSPKRISQFDEESPMPHPVYVNDVRQSHEYPGGEYKNDEMYLSRGSVDRGGVDGEGVEVHSPYDHYEDPQRRNSHIKNSTVVPVHAEVHVSSPYDSYDVRQSKVNGYPPTRASADRYNNSGHGGGYGKSYDGYS